jgi:hypothetical protein
MRGILLLMRRMPMVIGAGGSSSRVEILLGSDQTLAYTGEPQRKVGLDLRILLCHLLLLLLLLRLPVVLVVMMKVVGGTAVAGEGDQA